MDDDNHASLHVMYQILRPFQIYGVLEKKKKSNMVNFDYRLVKIYIRLVCMIHVLHVILVR